MHRIAMAALLAFSLVGAASAADAPGPYKLDAKGKCHSANGGFARQALCAPAAPPKHCKDPKTHRFVKCDAPGAVPA